MNQDWQNFLAARGAQRQNGFIGHFGDAAAERRAARDGVVLCDLSQFGTLRVSGEDAQSFLQNLLSNDIREVTASRAQRSSFNTAKGRMLASLLIWREGDDYLLQLPRELCEPVRKKLGMYVLRAKVKIGDASDEIVSLGVSGATAQEILRQRFDELPQQPLDVVSAAQSRMTKIGGTIWQIVTSPAQAQLLWVALSAKAKPVGSPCWDWLNIRSGIPVILPQTQEQFVAQMVNFDLLGGVSFKKGCYPGQEIVARMQYLGKAKRRMFLAHLDCDETPQAGDELFSADAEGQTPEIQSSGMIANAAPAPDGGYDVLSVVLISNREAQPIHFKSLTGATLQFLPPPYPLQ